MQKMLIIYICSVLLLVGCANQQLVGNDKDEYGCIGSAGYSWCESKQKCLRIWEENCTEENRMDCNVDSDCKVMFSSCSCSNSCIKVYETGSLIDCARECLPEEIDVSMQKCVCRSNRCIPE